MASEEFTVAVVDSLRGSYLQTPDIEAAALTPLARVGLHRVSGPSDLAGRIDDADVIISWHEIAIPASVLKSLRRCRGIVRAAVGLDNIDVSTAAELGIPVCNVPDYGTEEVADHAMLLILALVRRLRLVDLHVRSGGWDWRSIGSVPRLRGTTLGIVGFGRIGSAVARRAQAFGLTVAIYDPYVPSGIEKAHAVSRFASLHELLTHSRIVSLHVPLTDETRHLIGAEELSLMGKDSILVNTCRGEVVDQPALLRALSQGMIGQLGLDVLADEPTVPPQLATSDRVLLTAHSAFYADESLLELRHKAATAARRLLLGESDPNIVNGVSVWPGTT